MQIPIAKLMALLPLLADPVLGAAVQPRALPKSCRAELGTKSVKNIPTSTVTSTEKQTTHTIVKVPTITKSKGLVATKTTKKTTWATVTDTAVTAGSTIFTNVIYDEVTSTVPSTVIESSVITLWETSTNVTTVPQPTGFKGVLDLLSKDPSVDVTRRDVEGSDLEERGSSKKSSPKQVGLLANTFTTKVICTKTAKNPVIKTTTTTAKPTTVTTTYFSKTITKTDLKSSTRTVAPGVITSTKNVVAKAVYYETSLVTKTVQATDVPVESLTYAPNETKYAACLPSASNFFGASILVAASTGPSAVPTAEVYIADVVNPANVEGRPMVAEYDVVIAGGDSQEACCSACHGRKDCQNFMYNKKNRQCVVLVTKDGTCAANQLNRPNSLITKATPDTKKAGYVVGNGPCGYAHAVDDDDNHLNAGPIVP